MKTLLFLLIGGITGIIAFSVSFYYFNSFFSPGSQAYWIFGIIQLVMIISVIISAVKFTDELKGIPGDDEMTKQVNREAAYQSSSHVLSLWILILLASIWVKNPVILISVGILFMIIIFAGHWFYFRIKGIANDNQQN